MDSIYIIVGYSVKTTMTARLKSTPAASFETAIRFWTMNVFVAAIMQRSPRSEIVGVHQRPIFRLALLSRSYPAYLLL